MSSGAVLGTISTTTCEPRRVSSASSRADSACSCAASSVAVWSITRPASGGTGRTSCAPASVASVSSSSAPNRVSQSVMSGLQHHLEAGLSKLTVGGTEIWASF